MKAIDMNVSPSMPVPGKKVLIFYNSFTSTIGGSEYLPLLLIRELQRRGCSVILALNWESDLERAKMVWLEDLDVKKIKVLEIRPHNRFFMRWDYHLPIYRVFQLKKLAKEADIFISAFNIIDFGKPAHHFVCLLRTFYDYDFADFFQHKKPLSGFPLLKRRIKAFFTESILCPLLGVRPIRKILSDPREHVYVPSMYVAGIMQEFYGPFNNTCFYPPTTFETTLKDVKRNPLQIDYIGRIHPEKRLEDIISIVERARVSTGLDLMLLLAGHIEDTPYVEKMKRIAAEKQWIRLVGPVCGETKERFLLSGTYAIHAERDEAFGISITEYLKAGCIPIVPDEGGTVEIVDSPALTYHTNEEAASILEKLLRDEAFRKEQLTHCEERAKAFSLDAYLEKQRLILDKILSET